MNKKLLGLAALLAVCGFMTGCSKKTQCGPRSTVCRDGKAKKHTKARQAKNGVRAERNYLKK